jgi:hypothetical protein
MERFKEVCDLTAVTAVRMKSANMINLHKEISSALRENFGLPPQPAIRAVAKVSEAHKLNCVSSLL